VVVAGRDHKEADVMKTVIAAIALALLITTNVAPATPPEWIARLAPEIIKQAHKYHGILVSYEDSKGHFFVRDAVRCELFTEAFLMANSFKATEEN
jgi:hypothetical protein